MKNITEVKEILKAVWEAGHLTTTPEVPDLESIAKQICEILLVVCKSCECQTVKDCVHPSREERYGLLIYCPYYKPRQEVEA